MMEHLSDLEKESIKLDLDRHLRARLLEDVISYGENFIDSIEEKPVYMVNDDAVKKLTNLPFHEEGKSFGDLRDIIYQAVDSTGINPAAPGHLGYVPGGGIFTTALGDYLAAITNRYAGIYYANPGAVTMEDQCLRWMAGLVGYPDKHAGNLTSGGSIATLIALTAARDAHEINPENVRKQVIYLTQQTHHCVLKALRIAALDFAIKRTIPMTSEFIMDINELAATLRQDCRDGLKPFLIIGSAGSTDTGIIDPLFEMGQMAKQYGCWFHVDAAYGGFFLLVHQVREKFKGIADSDSVVLDPHKGLFLSYGTGAVLIKQRESVFKTHYYRANYMQDAEGDYAILNPSDVSPELTKHFRGMRMWLSVQLIGIAPFRAALEEKLLLARYFYDEVKKLGLEVGPAPTLSVCLFRLNTGHLVNDNELNQKLMERILASGKIFLSSTTMNDTYWMRICIMVFRTHKKHIDLLLELLQKYIRQTDPSIISRY